MHDTRLCQLDDEIWYMLLYPLEAVALDSEPSAKTKLIAIELIMAVCSTFVWGRGSLEPFH